MIPHKLSRASRFKIFTGLTLLLALLGSSIFVVGQEKSLKPGINKNFQNPDPDKYIERFEIESREVYHNREAIVEAMSLSEGMDVADIGAGTGFFSRMIANKVGPDGSVFAGDIAKNFLAHIEQTARDEGINNITTVLGGEKSTNLAPNSIDLAYICDTYHHFEYPVFMLESIHGALRPGGRLIIVDFERVEGTTKEWILGHVRCGKGTVTDEVKDAGFDLLKEVSFMEEQYYLIFQKK